MNLLIPVSQADGQDHFRTAVYPTDFVYLMYSLCTIVHTVYEEVSILVQPAAPTSPIRLLCEQ